MQACTECVALIAFYWIYWLDNSYPQSFVYSPIRQISLLILIHENLSAVRFSAAINTPNEFEDVGEENHHLSLKKKKWAFDQKHWSSSDILRMKWWFSSPTSSNSYIFTRRMIFFCWNTLSVQRCLMRAKFSSIFYILWKSFIKCEEWWIYFS